MISFRTRRVLYSTPVYMLLYFFIVKYLLALVINISDWYVLFITIILGFLHVVPSIYEEKKSRYITRILGETYGILSWLAVMFLIDILIIYLLKLFINPPLIMIYVMLAIVPVIGVYAYYHAHDIKIKEETLKFDNISKDLNIIEISDIHYGLFIYDKTLNKLVNKLKSLEDTCDLVIIAGDLADGSRIITENSFLPFKEVNIPIIFTPGNHDFYPGLENVYKACKKAGITILDNDKMEYEDLNIYGLTFSFTEEQNVNQKELVNAVNPEKVNIMIYHSPGHFKEFSKIGFDLELSGHTHGGQFYPGVWFSSMIFKYCKGLFENDIDGKKHYLSVTTGVGVMDYPFRWGTDSEILVLKLRKK